MPGQPHTMDLALDLLDNLDPPPLGELVTHRFALEDWRRALQAALDHRSSGAIKVVFEPGVSEG